MRLKKFVDESRTIDTLPDISDLPSADVVIYDGHCNFCCSQVRRLNWFANGRLAFISLHDPRVQELVPELTKDELMEQIYVVSRSGRNHHGGAAAIRYLSRGLPRLWIAAPLLHIPFSLPVWQYLYNQVAKNRYLISGRSLDCENDSCKIKDAK